MAKKPLYKRYERLQDKVNRHGLSVVHHHGKPSAAVSPTSQTRAWRQPDRTRQCAEGVVGMSCSMGACLRSQLDLQAESRGEPHVPRNAVFGSRKSVYSGLVNRMWRVVATGFCFAVFGIGGIVMALAAPVLLLTDVTQS